MTNTENYLFPNNLTLTVRNKFEADYLYHEIFENREYFQKGINLAPGDTVFDVGANIGMFAAAVHESFPSVMVHCFEPIPEIFQTLSRNAERSMGGTKAHNLGISDIENEVEFSYFPNFSILSSMYSDAIYDADVLRKIITCKFDNVRHDKQLLDRFIDTFIDSRLQVQKVNCRLTTLSHIIRQENIERIDLLKIDAEKSELDVLGGIEAAHWPMIRQIVMEFHQADEFRYAALRGLLEGHGFRVVVDRDEIFQTTDTLLVYAFRVES